MEAFERRVYSQQGEDGIIEEIFKRINTTDKFFVELGCFDCISMSNTALLLEQEWSGVQFDRDSSIAYSLTLNPRANFHAVSITAENVNDILRSHGVPREFDLLSLDIDGNDYWVWRALDYKPRVAVLEYNGHGEAADSKTIAYDPGFFYDCSDYFGATLLALKKLGEKKGYTLIYAESRGVNCFFVRAEYAHFFEPVPSIEEMWRPLSCRPYRVDDRKMVDI